MPVLAVVLLNYYGAHDTVECVRSVQKSVLPVGWKMEIAIGNITERGREESATEEKEYLLKELSKVQILDVENRGFAGGNNAVIRWLQFHKKPDVYILLNNDTVVHPESLGILAGEATRQMALISPKIYFSAGKEFHRGEYKANEKGKVLWYAGGEIDWQNIYAWHRGVDEVDLGQNDRTSVTDFATGCCMAFSKQTFATLGYMDEQYFMYLEDLDYSVRAYDEGLAVLYEPRAIIWHKNAGSTGSGSDFHVYYQTRNRLLFGDRWANWRAKRALRKEAERLLGSGSTAQQRAILDWKHNQFGKQKEDHVGK